MLVNVWQQCTSSRLYFCTFSSTFNKPYSVHITSVIQNYISLTIKTITITVDEIIVIKIRKYFNVFDMAHRAIMGLTKTLPKRVIKTKPFKNLLVLDFEATCIKDIILKPQEIIEFPCLVVSTEDWEVKDVFHEYIKPRVNPKLSDFCTELTGIMQETVDQEQYFPQVLSKFYSWIEDGNYFDEKNKSAFVTCGDWDLKVMFPSQCKLDNINIPDYFKEWINIKLSFYSMTKYYPRSLKDMLKYLNMEFEGRNHCGIDDTHNITRIVQALSKNYNPNFSITTKLEEETKNSV